MSKMLINIKKVWLQAIVILAVIFVWSVALPTNIQAQVENPQQGATGLSGTVPAPPPDVPATITLPRNGAVFRDVPVEVVGICGDDLLIKLYKNDVFTGSDQCVNGSWSITIDLFSGTNELVAIVFDSLDQEGPPSNRVTIEYDDDFGADAEFQRVNLTTNFARRGANPGETLIWPIIISGGIAPYALSIDWGDGLEDLLSRQVSGEFNISHIYEESGVYRIIIKITDGRNQSSFLQLVAIVNGPLGEIIDGGPGVGAATAGRVVHRWVTWPLFALAVMIIMSFWLGRRYEIKNLKQKFAKHQIVFSKGKD